jgi:hypothetical protein
MHQQQRLRRHICGSATGRAFCSFRLRRFSVAPRPLPCSAFALAAEVVEVVAMRFCALGNTRHWSLHGRIETQMAQTLDDAKPWFYQSFALIPIFLHSHSHFIFQFSSPYVRVEIYLFLPHTLFFFPSVKSSSLSLPIYFYFTCARFCGIVGPMNAGADAPPLPAPCPAAT